MKRTYIILLLLWSVFITKTQAQLLTLEQKIDLLISQMSLVEKIQQLHPYDVMNTGDNGRLSIPGFYTADGPHGYRYTESTGGMSYPVPPEALATSFPISIAVAATWDIDLAYRMAKTMAKEFCAKNVNMALAPALYLCNDPRNGRSGESYGEDPYLCAKIGAATVNGIQSMPLIPSIKSYICENAQNTRMTDTIIVSRRMLMEHWGWPFRECVQNANAMNAMSAYVAVNGVKASQSMELNKTILRDYWGFPYFMVSDWGSVHDAVAAISSGLDVCMGSDHYTNGLTTAVQNNLISETIIDDAVRNVLRTKFLSGMMSFRPPVSETEINSIESQQINYEAALKSCILLKNQNTILPVNKSTVGKVALIGPSSSEARLDGFGSSYVFATYAVTPKQAIEQKLGWWRVDYAKGCDINSTDTSGFAAALNAASTSDVVVFVGGLDMYQEGETYDRITGSTELPGYQQHLINRLASVNPNIIVVLESGGIVSLSQCVHNIKGLIYLFYGGQEQGNAIADVLFGDYNPGGKLPVTMPKYDAQLPPRNTNFNDDWGCGYRWFDKMNLTPEFAFGHGLSYTQFSYSNMQINNTQFVTGQPVTISVQISNTGSMAGDEVVQLYLEYQGAGVPMPEKQLKAFQRIHLSPGQSEIVSFTLNAEDFYYYDETINAYAIASGSYVAKTGSASDNLPLSVTFSLNSVTPKPDIAIAKILWYPPYPQVGDTVFFLANVKNKGTAVLNATPKIEFTIDGQNIAWSESNITIPAGGMKQIHADNGNNINYWIATTSGNFTVTALGDVNQTIDELNESNNICTEIIKVYDSIANPSEINLAWKKPVIASSVFDTTVKAEFAVDGLRLSRWGSAFVDNQYFIVDLLNEYHLNKIVIKWETAFASQYEILVSSDTLNGWSLLENIDFGNGKTDVFIIDVSARYIKINCITRSTPWGFSIHEIQAFGESLSTDIPFIANSSDITLYPNPATNFVFIQNSENLKISKAEIADVSGKTIMSIRQDDIKWMDVSILKQGFYFVKIYYKENISVIKLFKK